ncbi:hypothetical protein [Fontivita pretiosa]|uniref:hypothetical protein n=1 Tax=Fontivita pretiosa TaxID=2989684 RepID=UPI003D16FA0E
MAKTVSIPAVLVCWLAVLLACGCDRDQQAIRTYQIPKQPLGAGATTLPDATASERAAASSEQGAARQGAPLHASAAGGAGTLRWDVPEGWQAIAAGQMRVAAYQVSPQNPEVVLTVIPLGPEAGELLPNVNRWEGQIGLPPSKPQDLPRVVKRIEVAGKAVDLIDLSGPEDANPRLALLAAIVPHEGRVWFFKLAGPMQVVAAQREKFESLIRSIRVDEAGPPPAQAGPGELPPGHPPIGGAAPSTAAATPQLPQGHPPIAALAAASDIRYDLPQGWIKDDPKPLRHVSFTVAGPGGQAAEMIVSKLEAAGAGTYLDNINRWRGQVGLPPIKQGDPQPVEQLTVGGADAAKYDLVGPNKRMLVAVVAKGPDLWFFKFSGPTKLIDQHEPAFDRFLNSVQFVTDPTSQSPSRDPDQH